jgi:hypothetical protein
MAFRTPRTDLHPPSISRTFTDFTNDIPLCDQSEPTLATNPAGAPAPDINHLPSSVFVNAAAADVFAWEDILGNANSITFDAAFVGELPFTIVSIDSTTTVTSVTVSWHPEA